MHVFILRQNNSTLRQRIEMEIIIFALTAVTISSANLLACTTTCEEGQQCHKDKCESCPHGTFQDRAIHQFVTCKQWSEKTPYEHWIVLKEGTTTSDRVWGCEDGYTAQEYAAGESECIRDVSTLAPSPPSSTVKPATDKTTRLDRSNNNTTLKDSSLEQNGQGESIIAIAVAVPLIFILIIVIVVIWGKRRAEKSNTNSLYEISVVSHENEKLMNNSENADSKEKPQPSSRLPKDINMAFFLNIVRELGADDTMTVLNLLPNSNSEFNVGIKLSFLREVYPDPQLRYATAGFKWAEANPEIDHKHHIKEVLEEIQRADVLDKVCLDSHKVSSHEIT